MKRLSVALLFLLIFALTAPAAVIDFEDLTGNGEIPSGYGGITWSDQWFYYDTAQPPYTPASGLVRVYNNVGTAPARFSFGAPVVFNGAYFSGNVGLSALAQYDLYLGGILQASTGTIVLSDIPTFLASGYGGLIDEVRLAGTVQGAFVMDDVTFDETGQVPEPATVALVGLGLAGLLLRRRR